MESRPTPDQTTNIGVTNGIRSGDQAINRNSIDAILNNPSRTAQRANVAPGIMALTGLFSDGQVQLIMRGLAQKKGTDLMTAPSVTARSGQKATIEIIREFIYPTEYEPPELPNSVGSDGSTVDWRDWRQWRRQLPGHPGDSNGVRHPQYRCDPRNRADHR